MSEQQDYRQEAVFRPHSVAKGAGWLAAAHGASFLIKLALIPVLTRLLAPEEFGIVAASMALIMFIAILGGRGGLSAAVIVFHRDNPAAWRTAYSITLIIAGLCALIVIALAPAIASLIGLPQAVPYLRAVALLTPIMLSAEFMSILLVADNKYRTESQAGLAAETTAAVLAIIAAFLGAGAWALVLQHFLAQGIRFIVFTRATKLYPAIRPQLALIRPMVPYAVKSTGGELVNFFAVQAPVLLVSRGLGAASAGLYGVANRLSSLPGDIILHSLARMLFPAFAELKSEEERARAVVWSGTANTFLLLPILVGIAAVAGPLTKVILGWEFAPAAGILAGLAISKAITAPCVGLYAFMRAVNRSGTLFWLLAARAVFIIAGVVIGMAYGGLNGAAVGMAASSLPGLLATWLTVRSIVAFNWRDVLVPFTKIAACGAVMFVAVSLYVPWAEGQGAEGQTLHEVFVLASAIALGGAVYVSLLAGMFFPAVMAFIRKPDTEHSIKGMIIRLRRRIDRGRAAAGNAPTASTTGGQV
ncbi:oligosaccharide flippase family protein [Parvularcula flava]|uniref:Lipopolysaccharide biosynthesis protein n=1 Tax=Aquisalinus luteolus TaxID=1566827 RepID=A0A8J3EQ37_9PROT|nr:oligosaccharide flippase family protein [Aquisalinus luteolus]NHK26906.1 oligosaccharide flippase family protein [Aquisalinus luteolus]GGH93773.1 lipopolysaccharide biosynthesis protein [Aquisalinus luteolus]